MKPHNALKHLPFTDTDDVADLTEESPSSASDKVRCPLQEKVRAYREAKGWLGNKVNYNDRITHVRDGGIVRWLCFPRDRQIGYRVNGALVTDIKDIAAIRETDEVVDARALVPHVYELTRRPPRWRDLTGIREAEKLYPLMRAIAAMGPCYPFTINVGHERARLAISSPQGFLDYMRRRIVRHLRRALNRDVEFFAVVGLKSHGGQRPHIHGSILVNDNERELVRRALAQAADNPDKHAVDLQEHKEHHSDQNAYCQVGWADYCRRNYRESEGKVVGELITRTNALGRQAQQIYARAREAFLARED